MDNRLLQKLSNLEKSKDSQKANKREENRIRKIIWQRKILLVGKQIRIRISKLF